MSRSDESAFRQTERINMDTLDLVTPATALADGYIDMCREEIAHDPRLVGILPITRDELLPFFARWQAQQDTGDESTGGVPQSTYWLVRDGREVVGASRLRHRLTPGLDKTGGHIDYGVRPSERRKGYGTALLRLTLEKAWLMGICEVLVVCRKENEPSMRVIERNGGVLVGELTRPSDGARLLRYRISL